MINTDTAPCTVSEVPGLPQAFADTFTSHLVDVDGHRLHAVVGGNGPAVLLLPAWPEFWYGWRLVMPTLAQRFTVVAADLRGVGASDKPAIGYDAATLADDMAGLMESLGHDRYAVVGHDLGMIVGYALAARHRDRVTHLAVGEAILPGLSPSPPLFADEMSNEMLWHFAFNRLGEINEKMVAGREEIYFGHQFTSKAATPDAIQEHAIETYVAALRDPAALHASFQFYRELMSPETSAQMVGFQQEGPLKMPVLALGGAQSLGAGVEQMMSQVADDVAGVVLPDGHFPHEESPAETAQAVLEFLGQA